MPMMNEEQRAEAAAAQVVAAAIAGMEAKAAELTWSNMDTEFTLPNPEALEQREDLRKRRFLVEYGGKFFSGSWVSRGLCNSFKVHKDWNWVVNCKGNAYIVHVLRDGPPEVLPEGKKCLLKNILTPQVIKLLEQAPENATIRAMVLKVIKEPIPNKLKDFKAIQEWIEANIDQNEKKLEIVSNGDGQEPFALTARYSVTETGCCSFRRRATGRETYNNDYESMRRLLSNCNSLDDALDTVETAFREMVFEEPPDTEAYDESPDTYDEEVNDTEDSRVDLSNVRSELAHYLYHNMRAEYVRLFGTEEEPS